MWKFNDIKALLLVYLYCLSYTKERFNYQETYHLVEELKIETNLRIVEDALDDLKVSGFVECYETRIEGMEFEEGKSPFIQFRISKIAIKLIDKELNVPSSIILIEIDTNKHRNKDFYIKILNKISASG